MNKNDFKDNKVHIIIVWIAVAAWMAVIFFLSSQPAEKSNGLSKVATKVIIEVMDRIYPLDIETSTMQNWIDRLNSSVREYTHAAVFLALALFAINAFRRSGLKGLNAFTISFVWCTVYAAADEIHQIFVPGRAFELFDLTLDCTGALIGLGLYSTISMVFSKIRQRLIPN